MEDNTTSVKKKKKNKIIVGSKFINKEGLEYEIIDKIGKNKVRIRFTESKFEKDIVLSCISNNTVRDNSVHIDKYAIGNKFINNEGHEFEIIDKYKDYRTVKFSKTGFVKNVGIKEIRNKSVRDYMEKTVFGVGALGDISNENRSSKEYKTIYSRWYKMLERCYNEDCNRYDNYGRKGVYVCDKWLIFKNYIDDLRRKENYDNLIKNPKKWHIDKDILVEGNKVYSNNTTLIVESSKNTEERNTRNGIPKKNGMKVVKMKNGDIIKYYNSIISASNEEGFHKNCIRKRVNFQIKSNDINGYTWRKLKNKKMYYIITAISGSGKDTIVNLIQSELNIPKLKEHTTRPMRNDNKDQNYYNFTDKDFFEREYDNFIFTKKFKVFNGDIWMYGLHKSELKDTPIAVLILNPLSIKEFQDYVGKENCKTIFINVDENIILQRLKNRGDNINEIHRRINNDKKDLLNTLKDIDYISIDNNKKVETATQSILEIIKNDLKNITVEEIDIATSTRGEK